MDGPQLGHELMQSVRGGVIGGVCAVGLSDQRRGRGVRRQLEPARAAGRDVRQSAFRELLAGSEEGIASNILAARLKWLVNGGLISGRLRPRVATIRSLSTSRRRVANDSALAQA